MESQQTSSVIGRSPSTPQPSADAWQQAYNSVAPSLEPLRLTLKRPPQVNILRVNQVDAARLDVELTAMLREQLVKVFSLAQPGLLLRYEPELNAFLEFLIWRFSIWVDRPTPGNALMNLRYRDERSYSGLAMAGKVRTGLEGPGLSRFQKLSYCVAMVGGRYGWNRLQNLSAFQRWGDSDRSSWSRRAWGLLQRFESIYKAASFVNLVVFLHTGRYRSIIERVLKARLVYERPSMNRAVSFEYMNRQLVWHELSELLLLVIPLLNMISFKKVLSFSFSGEQSSVANNREDACPICERTSITVPYRTIPCGHVYCYFCLRTRCIANPSFRCARCEVQVTGMQRHQERVSLEGSDKRPG
ncbi:hypothetical protein R1sor_004510 [Riccia sorocarpa]|uniref:RING-type E3 ubiquitin transferase (cysteine targeting) n=1 Tax=Riccia sorocarpa TaxID=122646 RepID=A0ABD3HNA1_9MARC